MKIPSAVICELRTAAYRKKIDLDDAKARHATQQSLADQLAQNARQTERELRELLAFLSEHNAEPADWWADFDIGTRGCR